MVKNVNYGIQAFDVGSCVIIIIITFPISDQSTTFV